MESVLKDDRFSKISTDRRFRGAGKKQRKVQIDKRFQSMFKDERFVSKCTVDKRGRPQNFSTKENYRKYYDLKDSDESDSDEESDEGDSSGEEEEEEKVDRSSDHSEPGSEEEKSDENLDSKIKAKLRNTDIDYARGEANLYSDSSSDESSEDEHDEDGTDDVFSKWGELDADAERTEEATRRLAVCNMDWDRVGAEDIFLVLASFCPPAGCVKKVEVFLSDFGKERLKEEESLGPQELRRIKEQNERDEEDYLDLIKSGKKAAKAEKAAMERVRQYQINRLKYYYALVEFDSVQTANSVYEECDGMEYELSATRFDLRFVPDDMEFDSPQSVCLTRPNPDSYKPKSFFTTALQQGKVELTWDETDVSRQEEMKKAYELMNKDGEEDFSFTRNLIASSSDEDEDEDEDQQKKEEEEEGEEDVEEEDTISKYRSLLAGISQASDKKNEKDLEVSWVPEEENDDNEEKNLTPWEKYLKKKKDKKKNKLKKTTPEDDEEDEIPDDVDLEDPFFAEEMGLDVTKKKKKKENKNKKKEVEEKEDKVTDLDLLVMDSDDDKNHFNYKTIVEEEAMTKSKKKKWKNKKKDKAEKGSKAEDNFDVNVEDDRFAAIFSRPEYNIDPSEQNFKKTKGMEKLIGEKQKRIQTGRIPLQEPKPKKSKLDPETSAAVKSLKNKWEKNAKRKKSS